VNIRLVVYGLLSAGSGDGMNDTEYLARCEFLGTPDPEFRAFVESMPDKHWSKYDLSAVRLGWEAHKTLHQEGGKIDLTAAVFTVWWFASGEQEMATSVNTLLANHIWSWYLKMDGLK
jgi:hypothetical protein